MDNETEALADKYLRDAGYDPDLVRGHKSQDDVRREQWRHQNALKPTGKKQVGLTPPRPTRRHAPKPATARRKKHGTF